MKKFNDKRNIVGNIVKQNREKMHYSKTELSHKLELMGVELDRFELYKIETAKTSVKDFELIALCIVLQIDFSEIKEVMETDIKNYA
ncbi:MAG: helix-turn-helix transcriptional regulator [Clostridia bacterium]|nr:helix-turn-helix transcriptional regulator [Clostridia bacterium]